MKCLSICQPFAHLIISGTKTVELRDWNTRFRGEFLVHAPLHVRTSDCRRLGMPPQQQMVVGAVIGKATLYGVKVYESAAEVRQDRDLHHAAAGFGRSSSGSSSRRRRRKKYGFLLRSPKAFRIPIPYKGRLGFFEAELPSIIQSTESETLAEIIDEEHRYRLVGHH